MRLLCWLLAAICLVQAELYHMADGSLKDYHRIYKSEVVFAIELTTTGAVGAVAFPDGRIQKLASVDGNEDFKQLMSEWYHLRDSPQDARLSAEDARKIAKQWYIFLDDSKMSWLDWIAYRMGRERRDFEKLYRLDYYPDDKATQMLADIFSELKTAMVENLNLTETSFLPGRPYVEIAAPAWLFEIAPLWRHPMDTEEWGMSEWEASLVKVAPRAESDFMKRISTAVHRARFRRSVDENPQMIMEKHDKGDMFHGPVVAPIAILDRVMQGPCGGSVYDIDHCHEYRHKHRNGSSAVILLEPLGSQVLATLWLDEMNDAYMYHGGAIWTFWNWPRESGAETHLMFPAIVARLKTSMASMMEARMKVVSDVPIVLAGTLWSDDAVGSLQEALDAQSILSELRQSSGDEAVLEAAEYALAYQRSYFVCGAGWEEPLVPEPVAATERQEL